MPTQHQLNLRLELVPCRAAASTHLHGKVSGDAADLDTDGSSVTVPCVLLDLLEVAGRYPTLVVTLLFILLFLSTGPILRTLVLLSGLWANGDGLIFLGWRRQSAMAHAALLVQSSTAQRSQEKPARNQGSKDSEERRLRVSPAAPAARPQCWAVGLASRGRS